MLTRLRLARYRSVILLAFGLFALQGAVLLLMGQPAICSCGYIKLWEGVVLSSGNSQHLSDWYTFSHIIHGFLFYLLAWFFFPKMPVRYRILLAMLPEIAWEIAENTPWVINAYREQALAQGYTGDSVINSLFDTLFMMFGFLMAWKFPVRATVGIALAFEVWVAFMIRDNLTLNILNFIHQFEFISRWQGGG